MTASSAVFSESYAGSEGEMPLYPAEGGEISSSSGNVTADSQTVEPAVPEPAEPTAAPEAPAGDLPAEQAGSAETEAKSTSEEGGEEEAEETEEEEEEEEEEEQEASEEAIELIPAIRAYYTNEDLLAAQNIVHMILAAEKKNPLFQQIAKEPAYARRQLQILEAASADARPVGELPEGGLVYILSREADIWYYVESGPVRGFVLREDFMTGDEAQAIHDDLQWQAQRRTLAESVSMDEENLGICASALVPSSENQAWAYRLITTRETIAPKRYAICCRTDVNVREAKDAQARAVGMLQSGDLAYILDESDGEWLYVESGNVRGFVRRDLLETGPGVDEAIAASGEAVYGEAEELIPPEENGALYYSMLSVPSEGKPRLNPVRQQIVEEAAQYLGNPYVWGGVSLTDGADCSGFVQTLFSLFGYELPRIAEAQSMTGIQIPVEDALPGDLIFFAQVGYVYHVALYIGDGMDIEAYGTSVGIIVNEVDMANAVWATRIIED